GCFGCGAGGQGQIGLLCATVFIGDGGLAHARLAHALLDGSVDAAPGIGGRMIGQVRDSSLRCERPARGRTIGRWEPRRFSRGVRRRTNVCRIH
ncbi:hypothetical protein BRN37_10735, partial [Xanthomonas oryzae pv. oryzae]